jgi:8-oxo-dGTP pyrophosphatase MutT (NUDIX family)
VTDSDGDWLERGLGLQCPVLDPAILPAIAARLTAALAPPAHPLTPLVVDGQAAGWLDAARAERLAAFGAVFGLTRGALRFVPAVDRADDRTAAVAEVARTLAAEGALSAWRDERYAVAPAFGAPPWFLLERAAARYFGVRTFAAHVNGLVRAIDTGAGGSTMWFARRAPTKAIDPGQLDNLVGGGIAAGMTVAATVQKEAREEAGIPSALSVEARGCGAVHLCRAQPDGLQRETIFVHDLWLPGDFVPAGEDGEVVEHRRVDLAEAARLVSLREGPDLVTADASLVVLDALLRHGEIAADVAAYLALDALRHPPDVATTGWPSAPPSAPRFAPPPRR